VFKLLSATALSSLLLLSPAYAQSDAAKKFGAREAVRDVSVSPDGQHVSLVVSTGERGTGLLVATVGQGMKAILNYRADPLRLSWCAWATNQRLICSLYAVVPDSGARLRGMSRLIAVDADGANFKELSPPQSSTQLYERFYGGGVLDWRPDENDCSVLLLRQFVPEATTGTLTGATREGLGVERVDTVTLKRSVVEAPRATGVDFITDGHGTTRIIGTQPLLSTGYPGNEIAYKYRTADGKSWETLGTLTIQGYNYRGFNPYAVDRDLNVAYGFDDLNGRQALYKMTLDSSLKRELVLARNDVDVDGLLRIGRQQRVVGASYATERRHLEYFDPAFKALAASLAKALPGDPVVAFTDASLDEKKLVVFSGSDIKPGSYYLLDRTTRQMVEISPVRPDLAGLTLAPMKAITYTTADGTQVPAYLTLPPGSDGKNLPAIVMPHGDPTARDEWGFDWLSQFFANRGFAVIQPNYRGSSGYGEGWFRDNGFKSWKLAIGDVNDAGRWLIKQGITTPDKLAIVGWSYGGYAALQSSLLDSNLFKAVVAIAQVTDLGRLRDTMKYSTSDQGVKDILGDASLWQEASPSENAARIKAPVLLFHGDHDLNVAIGQSRLMEGKLKAAGTPVEFHEYKDLDHQLEDATVRAQMLDRIDGFLRDTMKLPAAQ